MTALTLPFIFYYLKIKKNEKLLLKNEQYKARVL